MKAMTAIAGLENLPLLGPKACVLSIVRELARYLGSLISRVNALPAMPM